VAHSAAWAAGTVLGDDLKVVAKQLLGCRPDRLDGSASDVAAAAMVN
jgi:hypothetical protein